MIRLVYEFGLFISCLAGVLFGTRGYCLYDMLFYSYLTFMATSIVLILFLFVVAKEEVKKGNGEHTNGNGVHPVLNGNGATPQQQNGFSLIQ